MKTSFVSGSVKSYLLFQQLSTLAYASLVSTHDTSRGVQPLLLSPVPPMLKGLCATRGSTGAPWGLHQLGGSPGLGPTALETGRRLEVCLEGAKSSLVTGPGSWMGEMGLVHRYEPANTLRKTQAGFDAFCSNN